MNYNDQWFFLFVSTVSQDKNIKYIKFTPLAQTCRNNKGHKCKRVQWWIIKGKVCGNARREMLPCIN